MFRPSGRLAKHGQLSSGKPLNRCNWWRLFSSVQQNGCCSAVVSTAEVFDVEVIVRCDLSRMPMRTLGKNRRRCRTDQWSLNRMSRCLHHPTSRKCYDTSCWGKECLKLTVNLDSVLASLLRNIPGIDRLKRRLPRYVMIHLVSCSDAGHVLNWSFPNENRLVQLKDALRKATEFMRDWAATGRDCRAMDPSFNLVQSGSTSWFLLMT